MDKVKILIVEDELETTRFLKRLLQTHIKCEIYEAVDGKDAIEKIKNDDFDLVILDLKMPGINGVDVVKTVKNYKTLPDIVVITAWDSPKVADDLIKEGALDYMVKPIAADHVMIKVKNILGKKGKCILNN